jgi:hypothetical protein
MMPLFIHENMNEVLKRQLACRKSTVCCVDVCSPQSMGEHCIDIDNVHVPGHA